MQHSRQILHWGREKQKKLEDVNIGVYGLDLYGEFLCAGLAGLGIGTIIPMDYGVCSNEPSLLTGDIMRGTSKAHALGDKLEKIYTGANYYPLHGPIHNALIGDLPIDLLISNSQYKECMAFAGKKNIPLFYGAKVNPLESCVNAALRLDTICNLAQQHLLIMMVRILL
jgi:hypothetical protein